MPGQVPTVLPYHVLRRELAAHVTLTCDPRGVMGSVALPQVPKCISGSPRLSVQGMSGDGRAPEAEGPA